MSINTAAAGASCRGNTFFKENLSRTSINESSARIMFKIADGLSILSNANAIYSNRKLQFFLLMCAK